MQELESLTEAEVEEVPDSIGRYPIKRRIGGGGMGVVYEAHCDALRERIAIKVISSAGLNGKNIQRFEQEARAVASLHHTNIVPIYEFGSEGDQRFYTMRLVDGPNLADVIHLSQLDEHDDLEEFESADVRAYELLARLAGNWAFIADLGSQAAAALEHAHAKNVLHRDIKPANLLVDDTDKLWVTDFGLAKRIVVDDELTSAFQTVGTPRYMAPEQVKGMADPRSDIYSLGLTLYELVTLQSCGVHAASIDERLPSPRSLQSKLPAELDRIITRAIDPSPTKRFQSAGELATALSSFAEKRRARKKRVFKTQFRGIAIGITMALALAAIIWTSTRSIPTHTYELTENSVDGIALEGLEGFSTEALEIKGPDARSFSFDVAARKLEFRQQPDYEVPRDQDMNNTYELLVALANRTRPVQSVRIQVRNENEPPAFDEFMFREDGETIDMAVGQLQDCQFDVQDDQDQPAEGLFFSMVGGADAGRLNLTPQGRLVVNEQAHEHPFVDANGDGIFELELMVSDSTECYVARLVKLNDNSIALYRSKLTNGANSRFELVARDCMIRRDVIDIASSDGKTYFHVHPEEEGLALFRSTLAATGELENAASSFLLWPAQRDDSTGHEGRK